MLSGIVEYQAVVSGGRFVRFPAIEMAPWHLGVHRIEVAVPEGTPITIVVRFSQVESAGKAEAIAREVVRTILNRLAYLHTLAIENPGPPQMAFVQLDGNYDVDFADVRGQEFAKRAMAVAASGGHNCLML